MREEGLDARRLLCPLPVIRVQDRVAKLPLGTILHVDCTDPGATQDIPAWCRLNGHTVIDIQTRREEYRITIRVGDAGVGS